MSKIIKINDESVEFDDGSKLGSYHSQDCCEWHYLDFSNLVLEDFQNLEFDLSNEKFFNRVEGFGIELVPTNGWKIPIPGYGNNNGYYGSNISLILDRPNQKEQVWDVSECQNY